MKRLRYRDRCAKCRAKLSSPREGGKRYVNGKPVRMCGKCK